MRTTPTTKRVSGTLALPPPPWVVVLVAAVVVVVVVAISGQRLPVGLNGLEHNFTK